MYHSRRNAPEWNSNKHFTDFSRERRSRSDQRRKLQPLDEWAAPVICRDCRWNESKQSVRVLRAQPSTINILNVAALGTAWKEINEHKRQEISNKKRAAAPKREPKPSWLAHKKLLLLPNILLHPCMALAADCYGFHCASVSPPGKKRRKEQKTHQQTQFMMIQFHFASALSNGEGSKRLKEEEEASSLGADNYLEKREKRR